MLASFGRWLQTILVVVVVAGCKYPELPRLEGQNADGSVVDGPPQFTSCMGLPTTCGPGANESCCRAEVVPGGRFYRSYDGVGNSDMRNPATVSEFVLDVYEVTVGRFRAFVNAGLGTQGNPPKAVGDAGVHPRLPGSGWDAVWNGDLAESTTALIDHVRCDATYQTWTDIPGANENKAMNCVSWYEAMAFCIWDGGYLPTESEWNYAASGGDEQRVYPWANPAGTTSIDCVHANYYANNPVGAYCVDGMIGGVSRVGTPEGDGKWKHADLAGNVWEWVLDWYDVYLNPCDDCANLMQTVNRVFRGGSFGDYAAVLRGAYRFSSEPSARDRTLGFRCARAAVTRSNV